MIAPWMPIGQWFALLFYGALIGLWVLAMVSVDFLRRAKPWEP